MSHRVGDYEFSTTDAERTLRHLGDLWAAIVHRRAPEVVAGQLPAATALIERLAAELGVAVPDVDAADPAVGVMAVLADFGGRAAERLGNGDAAGDTVLAIAWPGLRSLAVAMAAVELSSATIGPGTLEQISVSAGGVPKSAVATAEVDTGGVRGDVQHSRVHHGRPWQALCLWSSEVIDAFAAAGHGLTPGAAGENLTVRGLDWDLIRPGVVLDIGSVRAEVSSYAVPCSKNARWFIDGEFDVMHHRRGPVSRVYATVLDGGAVVVGDTVTIRR